MKKKVGKKEKKARKKNFVNELETVTFEQQILENNRQLARYFPVFYLSRYAFLKQSSKN